jgi:hypothetical protein
LKCPQSCVKTCSDFKQGLSKKTKLPAKLLLFHMLWINQC